MAGVPPTVGFYAKMMVIQSVVDAHLAWLAIYAVVLSVVGAYYYLRAIKIMYFDKADTEMTQAESGHKIGLDSHILLSANGLSLLALGIMPGALMATCVAVINVTMK
jgi:NADH-quinone oxidoreductase subunit N